MVMRQALMSVVCAQSLEERQRLKSRLRRAALVLMLLGLAGFGCGEETDPRVSQRRANLIRALGIARPTEARLVGFPFGPFDPRSRRQSNSTAIRSAAGEIRKRLGKAPNAEAFRDAAAVEMVFERPDRAVQLLQQAISLAPNDSSILTDLGAAYLARAIDARGQQASDLVSSLAASERALTLSPRRRETLFNRALALEKLFLRMQARKAWQLFQQVEHEPAWRREASRHVVNLRAPARHDQWLAQLVEAALHQDATKVAGLVKDCPSCSRVFGEDVELGRWAAALARGRTLQATGDLRVARAVGMALSNLHGEYMLRDSVVAIDQATRDDPERLRLLVEGHLLFLQALDAEHVDDYHRAALAFKKAIILLDRAKSPFSRWATLHLGFCLHFMGNPSKA